MDYRLDKTIFLNLLIKTLGNYDPKNRLLEEKVMNNK